METLHRCATNYWLVLVDQEVAIPKTSNIPTSKLSESMSTEGMRAHTTFIEADGEPVAKIGQTHIRERESNGSVKVVEEEDSSDVTNEKFSEVFHDQAVVTRTRQFVGVGIPAARSPRPQQSKRSRRGDTIFKLYEDGHELDSPRGSKVTAQATSHAVDLQKENLVERGEVDVDAATEQLFQDLSNATQRQNLSFIAPSSPSSLTANELPQRSQQAGLRTPAVTTGRFQDDCFGGT